MISLRRQQQKYGQKFLAEAEAVFGGAQRRPYLESPISPPSPPAPAVAMAAARRQTPPRFLTAGRAAILAIAINDQQWFL